MVVSPVMLLGSVTLPAPVDANTSFKTASVCTRPQSERDSTGLAEEFVQTTGLFLKIARCVATQMIVDHKALDGWEMSRIGR